MRKLLRSMARHNLEKAGAVQLNKRPMGVDKHGFPIRLDSKFSRIWREYIFTSKPKSGLNTKGAKA